MRTTNWLLTMFIGVICCCVVDDAFAAGLLTVEAIAMFSGCLQTTSWCRQTQHTLCRTWHACMRAYTAWDVVNLHVRVAQHTSKHTDS